MTNRNQAASTCGEAPLAGETLSCLIDGELDAAECAKLLGRLGADHVARREWLLLHVAGDALRSSDVACLQSDRFLLRMGAALEAEPPIAAPRASRDRARLVLPGAAVAAAAAMLAVIVVPQLRGDAPATTQTAAAQAAQNASTSAQAAPAAASPLVPVAATPAAGAPNEIRRLAELEAYLAAHRELAGGSMLPRTAPYLRASVPAQR